MLRISAAQAVALVLAAVLAGCSSDGKVREPAKLQDIVHPQLKPQTVWSARAGVGSDDYRSALGAVVAPDAVFTADVRGRVYAYEPATGKRIWRADTGARLISGPTVSGNAVFLGTMDGEVIALKRADGAPYWRAQISSEALAPPVSDGTLVIARGGDGLVQALSAVSGSRNWVFDRSVPNLTLRGLCMPVIDGALVYVGMDNGRVAALRMMDGQPLWEQLVTAPAGRNELERLNDVDGHLLLEDGDLFVASFGGELVRLDGQTGQVLWRRGLKSYTGPVRIGDLIVVADEAGVVWGLDVNSGAAAWRNEDLKYRRLSPAQAFAGHAVVGDFEGYLHWIDPRDGRLVARHRAGGGPIRSQPAVGDELLYVHDQHGRLSAIRID
ncbi:outer membrane protein assembly factor BamB [Sinimarinibacterium thermocellulolyticum]|uniref:Outer membrane protein assembly factor BamB n=1 Tax=Sinimarinibacterium thermocellulolyticum TaxID=3170016 RepID=A0ABV2AAT9_9GAMM